MAITTTPHRSAGVYQLQRAVKGCPQSVQGAQRSLTNSHGSAPAHSASVHREARKEAIGVADKEEGGNAGGDDMHVSEAVERVPPSAQRAISLLCTDPNGTTGKRQKG